jgi:NAD(P)-dependent dehydrogenase (short-subunit alcohol dehydrogenase family)
MTERKAVLITGAAGGIGLATAQRFAREGWCVGLSDLDATKLQGARAAVDGAATFSVELDVRDAAQWQRALAAFVEHSGGRLDVLVNNAGVLKFDWFETQTPAELELQIDVNVKGVMLGAHCALPYLRATEGAKLINVASQASMAPSPRLAAYSATKYAVRGLSEALDIEFMRLGVRVACIMPGIIDTPMLDVGGKDGQSFRAWAAGAAAIPPSRVADVIFEAVSGDALHYGVGASAEQQAEPLRTARTAARELWRGFLARGE